MVSGREFIDADGVSGVPAVIVNDQFAKMYWPGADPLGKRLRLFEGSKPGAWLTVVGVASNIVQDVTRQRRDPVAYVPYRQQPAGGMWVFARTRVAPGSLAAAFRREVQALEPDLPVWIGPYPLSERLAGTGTYWSTRQEAVLFLVFALIGLLLAAVGLYAVVATLGCWIPARRAVRVDPVVALRHE